MPPVQNMTDNCTLDTSDSHFAQDSTCTQVLDSEKHHIDAAHIHSNKDVSADSEVAESRTMNGDVHLEWENVQSEKESSIQSTEPCDAGSTEDEPTVTNITSNSKCEENDDFCDFESYSNLNHNDDDTKKIEEENFANFEPHSKDNQTQSKADDDAFDDDDFADFESATIETQTQAPASLAQPTVNANTSTDWTHLFQRTFLQTVQLTEESVDSSSSLSSAPNGQIFTYGSPESQALWDSLQDMDIKSICLLNKWKYSHSFKRILEALKVDGNIIKMNTDMFPPYSSHYGQILEPVSVNNWEQSSNEIANTSSSVDQFTSKLKSNELPITSPDEEFQTVISLNQDLDFFESKYTNKSNNGSSSTKTSHDLLSEFESIILDNGTGEHHQEESKQGTLSSTSPLSSVNDLRKMLQKTIAKTNNEQVLSAEALQILNELPRLNFARANVLMWNVNSEHSAPNG